MNLRTNRAVLVMSAVAGALAYWRLLLWSPTIHIPIVEALMFTKGDPYPQAIFLIAAILVYRRRASVREAMQANGSLALAAPLLLAGSLFFIWGHYVDAMDLLLVSFLLVAIGASLLWFGTRFVRVLAIPWIVLAFALPAPATLANQAYYALRLWTASQSAALLPLLGHPVFRHGNMIYGDDVIAQVVDSCSGLRSMEMLALAAVIYVGWYPVRRVRGALLVILAPVIAYGFNVVRVAVIALFPTSEFSRSHSMQGLSVFMGAVFGLVLLDRLLAHLFPTRPRVPPAPLPDEAVTERTHTEQESANESSRASDPVPRPSAVALVVMLVAFFGVSVLMPQWSPAEEARGRRHPLPEEIDGWTKEEKLEFDRVFFFRVSYSKLEYRRYERGDEELSVFIGYDDHGYRGRSLLSPKSAVPGRGWDVSERGSVELGSGGPRVERVVAQSISGRILSYYWYEGSERLAVETVRQMLAIDQSRFRRAKPARVIRITTELGTDSLGQSHVEAELHAFATSLEIALRE